ncbi:MAG: carboxylating nicotinate-nucleotide diphosphorylase [Cucumibacter sp.]
MPARASPATPSRKTIDAAVRAALAEDLGRAGDITGQAVLPSTATARATFNCRAPGIVAGLPLAEAAFRLAGPGLKFSAWVKDGDAVKARQTIAEVSGNARLLLAAERTALNFLCHLSGIATATQKFVAAVAGTRARISDTRKTIPGLRAFEKYAVRMGGGVNHRFGLFDAILIKDNHIAVAGSVGKAVKAALAHRGKAKFIEVEVTNLAELAEALDAGATEILLDNMSLALLRRAAKLAAGKAKLEASGGITLDNVSAIAETGVDIISTSRITMGAAPLDIGLDIEIGG